MPTHPFHLVKIRPWPILTSVIAIFLVLGGVCFFHINTVAPLIFPIILTGLFIGLWWRDVVRERSVCGCHVKKVSRGIKVGIILFIISEVMFFFSFFWAFYHRRLAPSLDLGCSWPPVGVERLNPFSIPLLNTAVLLASGASITWSHHGLLNGYKCELLWGLGVTIFLGMYFSLLQFIEYYNCRYGIRDSVFGASFFVATGFHGLHVIIGTTFLGVSWLRALSYHYTSSHHVGFEAAAWYWHFVDVVWLFLFLRIYWWTRV